MEHGEQREPQQNLQLAGDGFRSAVGRGERACPALHARVVHHGGARGGAGEQTETRSDVVPSPTVTLAVSPPVSRTVSLTVSRSCGGAGESGVTRDTRRAARHRRRDLHHERGGLLQVQGGDGEAVAGGGGDAAGEERARPRQTAGPRAARQPLPRPVG